MPLPEEDPAGLFDLAGLLEEATELTEGERGTKHLTEADLLCFPEGGLESLLLGADERPLEGVRENGLLGIVFDLSILILKKVRAAASLAKRVANGSSRAKVTDGFDSGVDFNSEVKLSSEFNRAFSAAEVLNTSGCLTLSEARAVRACVMKDSNTVLASARAVCLLYSSFC